MTVLVAYATKHGATAGIAERTGQTPQRHGTAVAVREAAEVGELGRYDAVVLERAVSFGSWMHEAAELVRRNRQTLAKLPVWLFSSGSIGDSPLTEPKEIAELRAAMGPRGTREFAGVLGASGGGFTERVIVRVMNAPAGDFRDWDDVEV